MKLAESLQPGDLDHLVLPLISVDEWNSKIDNQRAIVVAWQVTDKEPSEDLMKFIEGSNLDFLDCEISPNPNDAGYYLVFVEFNRNKEFPKILDEMVKQINNIASNDWKLKVHQQSDIVPYDISILENNVVLEPNILPPADQADTAEPTPPQEPVAEDDFWNHADVDAVEVAENSVFIHAGGKTYAWGKLKSIPPLGGFILEESRDVIGLRRMLGPEYTVWPYENAILVQNGSNQVALKPA